MLSYDIYYKGLLNWHYLRNCGSKCVVNAETAKKGEGIGPHRNQQNGSLHRSLAQILDYLLVTKWHGY
jgi:hypothetical protein